MKTPVCPRCSTALPGESAADGTLNHCPKCQVPLRITLLPAAASSPSPASSGTPAHPGEAVCFFHAGRRAEVPCERCGRFLCALCDLPVGREHLCPPCLESGMRDGHSGPLEPRRVRPDLIAGYLLLLGLLSCGLLFPLTGLAATAVAWSYRRSPPSLVDPSLFRLRLLMAAGVFCTLVGMGEWGWMISQSDTLTQFLPTFP